MPSLDGTQSPQLRSGCGQGRVPERQNGPVVITDHPGRMTGHGGSPFRAVARTVDANDLVRLAGIAVEAEAGLFARHPHGAGRYAGRLLCRALC
jgi:hypothetical protein